MHIEELIEACAKVPSFSTYEERLHPFVLEHIQQFDNAEVTLIHDNNLLVSVKGAKPGSPVVIASHLDKINHFGANHPEELDIRLTEGRFMGQMDNAVGVGVCLMMLEMATTNDYPPLLLLFSEMEESMGLKQHPHLLKNGGKDVSPQIGAKRLSEYIDSQKLAPATFITIDTTPVFKGDPGVALYTAYWEKRGEKPELPLLQKLDQLRTFILTCDPSVRLANGTNDYMIYGDYFSSLERGQIPSIALEPAIFPYHQIGEGVLLEDVHRILTILDCLLSGFDFSFSRGESL